MPCANSPLNADTIAAWTEAVLAADPGPIQTAFRSRGARGPETIWSPPPERLRHAPLRFLLEHWRELRGDRQMPHARQIDALALRPALGFVSLLDVVEGGADFRYRLVGTVPAAVSGFEMTRRLLSEHKASPYMVEYFIAVYRAMLRRPEPLYTEHSPPATVRSCAWHRIALPLGDDAGSIMRFLTANVPVGHDGEVITTGL